MRAAMEQHGGQSGKMGLPIVDAYRIRARRLKTSLKEFSTELPNALRTALQDHFRERLAFARGQPMLGEFAGFLFADLLGVPNAVADRLALPWLLLYQHSLLADDLVDRPQAYDGEHVLLSHVLLVEALDQYRRILGEDHQLWRDYANHYRRWVDGMLSERQWSKDGRLPDWDAAIAKQGEKAAIAEFCATALAFGDSRRQLTAREAEGVSHICVAVQLMDDLADLWEDHQEQRLNVLLGETYRWSRVNGRPLDASPDFKQVMASALESGAMAKCWADVSTHMRAAVRCFSARGGLAEETLVLIAERSAHYSGLCQKAVAECAGLGRPASIDDDRRTQYLADRAQWLLENGPTAAQ